MDRLAQGELEIDNCSTERMWASIFTNPLQGRALREFRAELINCPVEYEDESACEYTGKTTGVSDKNCVHTGKYNTHYRPYTESTRATIKSYMASPQE